MAGEDQEIRIHRPALSEMVVGDGGGERASPSLRIPPPRVAAVTRVFDALHDRHLSPALDVKAQYRVCVSGDRKRRAERRI